MSETGATNGNEMKAYSYTPTLFYKAVQSHTFIENCWVLKPIIPTYYAYCGMWSFMTTIWLIWLYCMPAQERLPL